MEAIVARRIKAFGHGLHALALTRPDQPRHVERAHLPPLLVPPQDGERLQKFRQRLIQLPMARAPIGAQTSPQQRYQSVNLTK